MECYLDNSATTRCTKSVAQVMTEVMCSAYGNPSSLHHKGVEAERYVREAREIIAKTLKCTPKEFFSHPAVQSRIIWRYAAQHMRMRGRDGI